MDEHWEMEWWNNICESTRDFSGQTREKQAVIPSLSLTKDSIAFFVPLQRHLELAQPWMRRGCTCFCPTLRQNHPTPRWWKVGRETKAAIVLPSALEGRGCLTSHIPQKQDSEGGLCTAVTPNGVNDNPVIMARDSGKLCGKWGRAIHRQSWPERLLNGEHYHSLSSLKSYSFSLSVASQTLCSSGFVSGWKGAERVAIQAGAGHPPQRVPHGPWVTSLLLLFPPLLSTN